MAIPGTPSATCRPGVARTPPFRPRLRHAGLRNLDRTRLAAFTLDGRGATASAKSPDGVERIGIASDYHVGCDGIPSTPRRAIDAGSDGDAVLRRPRPAFIRAPDPLSRMRARPA